MPNWCNNTITISGQTETIKNLWESATAEDGGLLSAMAPQPEDLFHGNLGEKERAECAEKGIPNWYDWQVSNWGTKWDVDTEGLEFTDNGDGTAEITGWFDSAWAPPIVALAEYLDNNSDVSIRLVYYEPGCDFMGVWEDGDDRCYSCSDDAPTSDSKFWETEDGKLIDDYMGCVERLVEYEAEQEEEANAK